MSHESNTQPIAIIGMACYYAGARDLKQLWENILARRRQFRKFPDQRLPLSEYYDAEPKTPDKTFGSMAAVIDGFEFDWIKRRVPKTAFESTDVAHWLALEVALTALEDSGYNVNNLPNEKTGVIVGNTLTGEQTRAETMRLRWPFVKKVLEASGRAKGMSAAAIAELTAIMEKYYKSVFAPITEDTLAGGLSNTIPGRICNYLDLHGGAYTVDGACSSSVVAVANAASLLVNQDLDLAFAGGVDISLDTFELVGFSKTGALTSKDMTVYDRKASGFIPGEGCGFVIMKRLEDAQRDNDYIYAILHGWGLSTDGKGGITAPNSAGQARAIRRAYERAGYSIKEIDFIEGHGTGTAVGDRVELNGIALALGDYAPPRSCGVTSFKSIFGHTKAASGIGGFIKAVMAVNQRVIPPVANCTEPNPVFEDTAKSLYPIIQGQVRDPKAILKAGITGAGFGGENCHLTITSGDEPTAKLKPSIPERSLLVSHQNTELFVLSGASISDLIDRLKTIKNLAQGMSFGEMVDLAVRLSQELKIDAAIRAAIIADSPNNLLKSLEQLEGTLQTGQPREGEIFTSPLKDIWAGNSIQNAKVGFLFPGQGSQQLNMARTFVERHLWAQELLTSASNWIGKINDRSIAEFIYKPLDRSLNSDQTKQWYQELTQTQVAQPAICLASLFWLRQLKNLGIEPAVVGGHSLGELTAFHAAGVYDEATLLKLAALRGKAMASPAANPGAMASLSCSLETAASLIKERNGNGYVAIANINSPEQIVISGNRSSVEAVVELATKENINARLLPVSNAFHSQLVANAAEELKNNAPFPEFAEAIKVHIFSGVDGVTVAPGFKLREHFAQQVIARVNFVSLVQSLSKECDLIVEVGPGKILSNLVSAILGDNNIDCFPLESKPGNDKNLNTFLGCYFAHGGNINWMALYENRLVRPFVPASEKIFIENPCEHPFQISQAEISQTIYTGNGFEAILSQNSDFTPQQLSEYLSHRGQFIEAVIKADLQNMPSQLTMKNISDRSKNSNDPMITGSIASKQETMDDDADSVATVLLDKVSQKTGFPVETLTLELHLLDDLNLDSIKSAELIAEVRKQLGITQQLDPTKFANASLGDVVNILEGYISKDKKSKVNTGAKSASNVLLAKVSQKTGFPIDTLSMTLRLLDDLNLDSIKSAELIVEVKKQLGITQKLDPATFANASLGDVVIILEQVIAPDKKIQEMVLPEGREPWVRNFILKPIPQPISDVIQEVNGSFQNILIVSEPEERHIAMALEKKFKAQRANIFISNFSEIEKDQSESFEPTAMIVILPQHPEVDTPILDRLLNIVHRLHTTVNLPFRFYRSLEDKSLTCIEFGGQFFGAGSKVYDIEQGCAKALLASLHLEHPELKIKIIDFDQTVDPKSLAETVFDEMMDPEKYEAICYDAQLTRHVLRAATHDLTSYSERKIEWSADDVILVTGGAKGITAECALALAKSTGVKMVLVGSSPYAANDANGQSEIAQTMERYQQEGLVCQYYQCDIANNEAVKNLVEIIRREMGEITGVIHGAGVNKPRPVSSVTVEDAYNEIAPKVVGALNLMSAFQDRQLKLFVGLTSIIGVSGMKGNAWYGFSNEALDLLSGKFQADHPQTAVCSLAFSVWNKVGMGARMGSTHALAAMGIDSIPLSIGVERFLHIVNHDPAERQVIIAARFAGLDTLSPEAIFPLPQASRFLEQVVYYYPQVEVIAQAHLTLEKDSYVKDHVWRGSHLFPTVFGLEAMAQAVAYVTGENDFQRLRIEDIHLDRPIVVNPEHGINIQIRAEVLEGESANDRKKVQVAIATEQSDFEQDHFSATFIFTSDSTIPQKEAHVNRPPLDIIPKDDLYGWLLFQGLQFQRLQQVYHLDSRQCRFSSEKRSYSSNNEHYILGDPFFRDSLLQSPQLVLSQDLCLPVYIESIEIYQGKNTAQDSFQGCTELETVRDKKVRVYTDVIDENGAVIERLNGYTLQILEHHAEFPTPEQIADPSVFDTEKLSEEISNRLKSINDRRPEITLTYFQGLHHLSTDERRQRELPMMETTVKNYIDRNNKNIGQFQIDWLDTGKPVLANGNGEAIGISISHDDRACLCVAGSGAQGCDLAPITIRSREDWIALLGADQETMVDKLITGGDNLDRAGTRIWAAKEALVKAYGLTDVDLEIGQQDGDSILFKSCAQPDHRHVMTFPIALNRSPERMIAIVVAMAESEKISDTEPNAHFQSENFEFDKDAFASNMEIGARGEPVYVFRFPITFRETANVSHSLYYSNYFNWMGKIREYPLKPVYEELVKEFASGKWGMVTNSAETTIYGEAKSGDMIEGRLWMDNISGAQQSTMDMRFEWRKVRPDGDYEVIAHSKMKATWVAITGHGMVEVKPFAKFFQDAVDIILPPESRNLPAPTIAQPLKLNMGPTLADEPAGPVQPSSLVHEETIATSLEDSNLVGNIYFANYYTWQGRVRDNYLYQIAPEIFNTSNKCGEFRCVNCKIEHVREAMPFDRIVIKMYRRAVQEKGIRFYFDYYRVSSEGKPEKLAYGEHEAVWFAPDANGKWLPGAIPAGIRDMVIAGGEEMYPVRKAA